MTITYALVLISIGFLSSYIFSGKLSLLERLALSIGLGILFVSFGLFIVLSLGYSLNLNNVTLTLFLIVAVIVSYLGINKNRKELIKSDFGSFKRLDRSGLARFFVEERKYITILVALIVFVVFSITSFWPISEWDALTLYDFRGRVYSEGLTFKDVQKLDSFDTFNAGYYFSYPPSTSLIHALFYITGSNMPQIIYPIIFVSLLLFFFVSISKHVNFDTACITTSLLAVTNIFVSHASVPYTNLPFTYFYFVSSISLIEYLFDKNNNKLLLSAVFLAGASWMRSVEPFYVVNILLLIIFGLIKDRKYLSFVKFVIPVLLLRSAWSVVQDKYATTSFLNKFNTSDILGSFFVTIPNVAMMALLAVTKFITNNAFIFVILVISTLILFIRFSSKNLYFEKVLLFLIYSNLAVIVCGTFAIGVLLPGRSEIFDSINRFGIFLYPFTLYFAGMMFKEVKLITNSK